MEIFRRTVQHLEAYFYAGSRIIALMWAIRLHRSFDALTNLFDLVGLRTNMVKMVIMECQPYCTLGVHLAEAG